MKITDRTKFSLYSDALRLKIGLAISPRMAILHLTNRCRHRCTGCEYADVHFSGASELTKKRCLELIDEIADLGALSILFSGGGEPTLHKSFPAILEKAKKRNLSVGIFSNGDCIDRSIAECIVRSAIFIRISVDASTAETYGKIRQIRPVFFDKLLLSVEMLTSAKKRLNSKIKIGLKFLVRPCNIDEISLFPLLAKKVGAENVQYKPIRNSSEDLNDSQAEEARGIISELKKTCEDVRILGEISPEIKVETPCWASPMRIVISADGNVYLCNYFNHRKETHSFGNINENFLRDIWFRLDHREVLKRIQQCECELYDCRFHKLNTELLELVEHFREQFDFV